MKKMKKKNGKKEIENVKKKRRKESRGQDKRKKINTNTKKHQINNKKIINKINFMTKNTRLCPEDWLSGFNQYKKVIIGFNDFFDSTDFSGVSERGVS